MHFLFSGEGPTDCGTGRFSDRICTGEYFQPGPMVHLASQIVERADGYSPVDSACCGLVSRPALKAMIADLKANKKRVSLRGPRQPPETLAYRRSARALAPWARHWASDKQDEVVAIYFRDTDDRQSTHAQECKAKSDAVLGGFEEERFLYGVPMLPRPASEAWLLCVLKSDPYENCNRIEGRAGSPNAKLSLKTELRDLLGAESTRDVLCPLVDDGTVDSARIDMPSFNAFRERLTKVIRPFDTND